MSPRHPTESTATLLFRLRGGDDGAREQLIARYLPMLRRWAHGRMPARARSLADTDDLVQVTLLKALDRLGEFEPRGEGAFLAYLRRILLNSLRDELRRAASRPGEPLALELPDGMPSLVEQAIGREMVERYEQALEELEERPREAIILRLEFGYSHQEVAEAVGYPSANTARMAVARALVRVSELLGAA